MKIAITGGMGCGKSTVINALSDLLPEYRFASYDSEVQKIYKSDWKFRDLLQHHFGTVERSQISSIVFRDRAKLDILIDITKEPMLAFMHKVTRYSDVVVEVPMLYQIPGYPEMFDKVFAIWCDKEAQRARVKARDIMMSDEMIDRKLAIQLSADEIASKADFVIDTSDGAVDVIEQLSVVLRVAELKSL